MKKLLARFPWLNSKNDNSHLVGIYIASDKVISVVLHRVDNAWEIDETIIESFHQESEKIPAVIKAVSKLPSDSSVCLIIPENMYQWVQLDKPNLPEQEIVTSLPWTVKELVSMESTDIIADYFDSSLKQGGIEKINVVVTSRTLFKPLLKAFHDADISLHTVTTSEMILCDMVEHDGGAHMLVSQQLDSEPSLHIIRNGELLLSRKLRGLMGLAQQPLNQLKLGLLDAFGLELQRSLDYFESQLKQPPIKSLQLAIPNLELHGLAQELSQFFPAKVIPFNPISPLCQQQNAEMQLAIAAALSIDSRGTDENTD